jgi:hypothetical protein
VAYSASATDLVLQLDGYQPLPVTLTPDHEQDVRAKMKAKKRGTRPRDKDDVESPF